VTIEIDLTQADADALIAMEKHRVNDQRYIFPSFGGSLIIPLQSFNKREQFLLDISRGKIDLLRVKFQDRARQMVVLMRLDLGGRPHRNPDETEIPCPHLHLYRQGYGDKWAFPVPPDGFTNLGDPWQTLEEFMTFSNITQPPFIERDLFI
jgi:hypothetical protein